MDAIPTKLSETPSKEKCPCVICISSGKGGVGKTSIALSLARELSQAGKVLVVDLDYFNRGATGLLLGRLLLKQKGENFVKILAEGVKSEKGSHANVHIDGIEKEPNLFFSGCAELSETTMRQLEDASVTKLCQQLQKTLLHLADQLQSSCVILDAHGGPDTLSFAAASVADYTIMVSDPDKVTLYGTLNFVARLREALPSALRKPRLKLLFNRVSKKFSWPGLTQIYSENLNDLFDGALLGAVPFVPSVFENFASAPFISALFPKSLFAKKIQLATRDLLGAERPELLSKQIRSWSNWQARRVREAVQDRSLARPFPIAITWLLAFVCSFIAALMAALNVNYENSIMIGCEYVAGFAAAFLGLVSVVNSIRLLFQGMATSYRFQMHTPLASLYRLKLFLQTIPLLVCSLMVVLLLVAFLLPALYSAKEKAMLIGSSNNLKQIALGVRIYAGDNDDQFPTNLLAAYDDLGSTPKILISPRNNVAIPDTLSTWPTNAQYQWIGSNIDYVYLGAGRNDNESDSAASTNILAFERFDTAKDKIPVAFDDGHVETLLRDDAKELIETQTGTKIEELEAR